MKGFLERILQEIMKKIMLGTSDAWSMRRSFHRPSDPAYYIEDCRIFGLFFTANCGAASAELYEFSHKTRKRIIVRSSIIIYTCNGSGTHENEQE